MNQIDPDVPASMSKTVITDLLRTQLGFEGVVISDDMTMGAIAENYTITDAAIKSLNAGCDLLLVCHGYENEIAVLDAVKKAVLDGTIDESRIEESVYRILKLKEKYHLTDETISSVDIDSINQEILTTLDTYIKD
jgi:beta-N-acetylhexosaminidase